MRAVFSSTYDDQYLFFLPITVWCWNKLDVKTTVIMPNVSQASSDESNRAALVFGTLEKLFPGSDHESVQHFKCPKHKEATYAQVGRLFAGAMVLPKDEILVTTDIDMLVFKNVFFDSMGFLNILGHDLVPSGQFPMCYAYAKTKVWRDVMNIGVKSFQECLDEKLGHEECENMRGNLWARDQELLYQHACGENGALRLIKRARPETQFAMNRIDRDDSFFMDRLNSDIIDYHMHRPGYTQENFHKILGVIQYFYPGEALTWMMDYRNQYVKLIQ